ncbi:unnamed protein product [Sphenostylis stenocarpa]|uniref:Kinesin motor domain-containing protein n=1 Tax=Sphenostylis stenocarpa TaxID=92480 RepID=A0AA86T090_9FABA|nr:unnamed protein product [Sphenostylis stenocarpa]
MHEISKSLNLKKQHIALSDEVKQTTEPFSGIDVLKSVRLLVNFDSSSDNELQVICADSSKKQFKFDHVFGLEDNQDDISKQVKENSNSMDENSADLKRKYLDESSERNRFYNEVIELKGNRRVFCRYSSKKQFKFDHVLGPEDNQVLDGYNVCIFAYGQTGTEKTLTMEGTPEQRGVNYRILEELFRITGERHGIMKYEMLRH